MWTNLGLIIPKNRQILNQFSSPTVCLPQQYSRLNCEAADAIDFLEEWGWGDSEEEQLMIEIF